MAKISETPGGSGNASSGNQPERKTKADKGENIQQAQKSEEVSKDARTWAMLCHLAGLGWLLVWIVPVVGGVIGSLIVWQVKKDEDTFIDEHGKEAVNFQISMLLYWIISVCLCLGCIGFVLVPIVTVVDIIFAIIAAMKAGNGQSYHYPLTIRFVK